jgi:hypothetical protein
MNNKPFCLGLAACAVLGLLTGCAVQPVAYAPGPPPPPVYGATTTIVYDHYGAPPPLIVENRPPPPTFRHEWVAGHWRWNGHRYVWARGHYRPV